jgi:hypothetical protein
MLGTWRKNVTMTDTRPNRTERKRANLKFAKMRRNEKQMADKAVGLNYESGLSMMTQPLG